MTDRDPILGCLLGTAVGDSLGLPCERLSRRRIARLFPGAIRQRLVFGRGMVSDDTEHTAMVARAISRHSGDAGAFQRRLAWSFRWWLLALPAGVGMATARAILRLWVGFPPSRSGVYSGGNGPAMRSAIIGVFFRSDTSSRRTFTRASAELTHTDPRAVEAALVVAEAASLAANRTPTAQALPALEAFAESREMQARFKALRASLDEQQSVEEFAIAIGCGDQVSGFAPNSAALALYAWLRHRGDFASAISEVVRAGGDTDTGAAIAGGICGAEVGAPGIPHAWVERIADWPLSVGALRDLAERLSMEVGERKSSFGDLRFFAAPMRNLLFLAIILFHGFRRLLPPY